jgi:hypothetical protein
MVEFQMIYSVSVASTDGEQEAASISNALAQATAEEFAGEFASQLEQDDPGAAATFGMTAVTNSATPPSLTLSLSSPTPSPVSAKGDPHLVNVYGQRFDLMQPGVHSLVLIPKSSAASRALLSIEAEVRRLGAVCTDMYIQAINVTGAWASTPKHPAGVAFSVTDKSDKDVGWLDFGMVTMKVVHAHTKQGVAYLNFLIRHLARAQAKYRIGGLLGEDDHTEASMADPACARSVNL